ncbi:hypothetical protein ACFYUR_16175 [Micromonospora haikouensis]
MTGSLSRVTVNWRYEIRVGEAPTTRELVALKFVFGLDELT